MKPNHFYSYFRAIKEIKKQGGKLEKDGWVVKDGLCLIGIGLYFLPIIKKVDGGFDCGSNQLTTLQGAPQKTKGSFYCNYNKLTTLQGAPQEVGGNFYCSFNYNLITLKGAPNKVGGYFSCDYCKLTSLKFAPQEVGCDFYYSKNPIEDYSELDKIKIGGKIYK